MRVRVLAAFDVGDRGFRIGDVTELSDELAARLVERRLAELVAEAFQPEAMPRKGHERRKP